MPAWLGLKVQAHSQRTGNMMGSSIGSWPMSLSVVHIKSR